MELRDYQEQAVNAVFEKWQTHKSTLVVAATGLGKTIIFAHIIKRVLPKRVLVIAHRKELIDQACDKIRKVTGLECGIEMGWTQADDGYAKKRIVVATVQSLNSGGGARMRQWKPEEFGLIICDEGHHAPAATYRRVFEYFGQNPDLRILFTTATPDRADEEALNQVCESMAFEYDILAGCENGWLVPITQQFCPVSSLDFSHCRTTAGDLNQGDLEKIMEAEENIQGVCHPALEVLYGLPPKTLSVMPVAQWEEYLKGLGRTPRRAIVFTVSVAQAQACCNIFNRVVPKLAEFVCGKTPIEERERTLERFASGETSVVANCGVLTEGFDNPAVEVIFMARPTKSRSLYTQMIGRATRPLPGVVDGKDGPVERKQSIDQSSKPRCRVIDFVGNSGRHKLICAIDVLSGKASQQAIDRAIEKAKDAGKPVTVLKQLTQAEWDLEKERRKRIEDARLADEARKKKVVAKVQFNLVEVDHFGKHKFDDGTKGIRKGKVITDHMKYRLRQCGIDPNRVNWKQAKLVLAAAEPRDPSRPNYDWYLPSQYQWMIKRWGYAA